MDESKLDQLIELIEQNMLILICYACRSTGTNQASGNDCTVCDCATGRHRVLTGKTFDRVVSEVRNG